MDNFIERAIAVKQRYYDEAIALTISFNPNVDVKTFILSRNRKIEILSQLVATHFMYDGNIPNKFSIQLTYCYNADNLREILQLIFKDLATTYNIEHVHSLSTFNGHSSAYAYNIILTK